MPLTLEDIVTNVWLVGLASPTEPARVVAVDHYGDAAVEIVYADQNNRTGMAVLEPGDLSRLRIYNGTDRSDFDGDAENFRLASEALRIKHAALYDPMAAVNSSAVTPLPHQIRAVYEELLPRIPLRFLLADDPGAGKTIMAGLYIKELVLRASCDRVIIVCPGGLADQWQDELLAKFELHFDVFDTHMLSQVPGVNPFEAHPRLIVRMDQLARNEELLALLEEVTWDVAIVDEAHRMSASYQGSDAKVHKTKRYLLGEKLRDISHHVLLMTATPHAGKEDDFQLFLSLLDPDRFAGRFDVDRHGHVSTEGIMRRMVKEDLLTFDGKPLFPERRASTVKYALSEQEQDVYDAVTEYVRTEMNRAARLADSGNRARSNRVGFALTVLQRRLASSPEAIYQSLSRRHERLSDQLRSLKSYAADRERFGESVAIEKHFGADAAAAVRKLKQRCGGQDISALLTYLESSAAGLAGTSSGGSPSEFDGVLDEDGVDVEALADAESYDDIDLDVIPAHKLAALESAISAVAAMNTAANSLEELEAEILSLEELKEKALHLRQSRQDRKWQELSHILSEDVLLGSSLDADSEEVRKIIIFTEHRDTLDYLQQRISEQLGRGDAVVAIHGGTKRLDRLAVKEHFTNDPRIRVLLATDAAGEGLNLQRAHLMVNYDLPWNPNRIEQRFGRIHCIGQKKVCHLWNLVADGTREGYVFDRLLSKIDVQSEAYNGKIFNVLGGRDAFSNCSLADLIKRAILEGDSAKADIDRIVDASVGEGARKAAQAAIYDPLRSQINLDEVRELMDRALERRLQPGFIEGFFLQGFKRLGGQIAPVRGEHGRYEVLGVPHSLIASAQRTYRGATVSRQYERVTFDPNHVHLEGSADAVLLAPGHPLLDIVIDEVLSEYSGTLDRGTVLIDNRPDAPPTPRVLFTLDTCVNNSESPAAQVARFYSYAQVDANGSVEIFDAPTYLDYDAPTSEELEAISCSGIVAADWLQDLQLVQKSAKDRNYTEAVQPRVQELKLRQANWAKHLKKEIRSRLIEESEYYSQKRIDVLAKHPERLAEEQRYRQRAEELSNRIEQREAEIDDQARLSTQSSIVRSRALVVPRALIEPFLPEKHEDARNSFQPALDTTVVERRAVDAVLAAEKNVFGRHPTEMPHNNKGFDIITRSPDETLFIEVKGRISGAEDFHITSHEVHFARTHRGHHYLALVEVSPDGPDHDRIRYLEDAFAGFNVAASTHSLRESWVSHWSNGFDPYGRLPVSDR